MYSGKCHLVALNPATQLFMVTTFANSLLVAGRFSILLPLLLLLVSLIVQNGGQLLPLLIVITATVEDVALN